MAPVLKGGLTGEPLRIFLSLFKPGPRKSKSCVSLSGLSNNRELLLMSATGVSFSEYWQRAWWPHPWTLVSCVWRTVPSLTRNPVSVCAGGAPSSDTAYSLVSGLWHGSARLPGAFTSSLLLYSFLVSIHIWLANISSTRGGTFWHLQT